MQSGEDCHWITAQRNSGSTELKGHWDEVATPCRVRPRKDGGRIAPGSHPAEFGELPDATKY